MARNETRYNKIIGITKNHELVVLEYTFEDSDSFKGAVGNVMGTITEQYIEDRKSFDNAEEYMWQEAVSGGYTDLGFEEWWDELVEESEMDGCLFPYDDDSYRYKTEELYDELSDENRAKIEEVLGVKGEDYVTFDCVGGGRCFKEDTEWEVILEPELLKKVNDLEHVEPTYCSKCGKEIGGKTHNPIYHFDDKEVCEDCHKELSDDLKNRKEREITMKVAGYLMNLPKEQVVQLVLTKIPSYKLEEVVENATGDSSNWVYLNEEVMNNGDTASVE